MKLPELKEIFDLFRSKEEEYSSPDAPINQNRYWRSRPEPRKPTRLEILTLDSNLPGCD